MLNTFSLLPLFLSKLLEIFLNGFLIKLLLTLKPIHFRLFELFVFKSFINHLSLFSYSDSFKQKSFLFLAIKFDVLTSFALLPILSIAFLYSLTAFFWFFLKLNSSSSKSDKSFKTLVFKISSPDDASTTISFSVLVIILIL